MPTNSVQDLLPPMQDVVHSSPRASPARAEGEDCQTTRGPAGLDTPEKSTNAGNATNGSPTSKPASTAPPAKKKRLTPQEKEAREKEAAAKKKEKEEKLAEKAREKEEKEKEAAEKKRIRELEAAEKAAERAKVEEEKAARKKEREEKMKQKEDEKRLEQEKKEKEAAKQQKLKSFFGSATPKKPMRIAIKDEPSDKSPSTTDSAELAEARYRKMFQPFFLKEHVRLAGPLVKMDEETRQVKSKILDEFFEGKRVHEARPFDPVEMFSLHGKPEKRGRLHHPVKHIMEQVYKETNSSGGGSDDTNRIIREARAKLAKVPMKVIAFSQDVRPPYYGTVTFKPFALGVPNVRKAARRSMAKRLSFDYDYDSEAEWQEEEGEDVDIDDDEEELEEEDDMEGFLDDSEDAGPARRLFGNNNMEPESSGLCFENQEKQGPNPTVYEHKMELILGKCCKPDTMLHPFSNVAQATDADMGLDPWATSYWEPDVKKQPIDAGTKMPPPPAPVAANALAALGTHSANSNSGATKMVKPELMDDLKRAILNNKQLSKMGILDVVFSQFRNTTTKVEVKNTIEAVAERTGNGRVKEWALKPGHEIAL